MNLYNIPTDKGIIKTIIIIVAALLILSYFGYNLRDISNSPTAKDNFSYVGEVISNVWNNYLKGPTTFIWNIFITYIWEPAFNAMIMRRNGQTDPTLQTSQTTANQYLPKSSI